MFNVLTPVCVLVLHLVDIWLECNFIFINSEMKTKLFLATLCTMFLLCGISGCHDDETDNPRQLILGKWELVSFGNSWEYMYPATPTGYSEYLPDNTIRYYNYATQKYDSIKGTYHIDSLLRVGGIAYEYRFYDDKMDLRIVNVLAEMNNFRYKRVK